MVWWSTSAADARAGCHVVSTAFFPYGAPELETYGVRLLQGVLACKQGLRPFGLLIAAPGDLLEQLSACCALHCLLVPQAAYWPLLDQARVTHLINALPPS